MNIFNIKEDVQAIESGLSSLKAKLEGSTALQTAETDLKDIGTATLNFIKTNGLPAIYQIALTVIGALAPGASWGAALASIEAQALAAGHTLVNGAAAIVASMAQADLIAAGKIAAPTSTPAA